MTVSKTCAISSLVAILLVVATAWADPPQSDGLYLGDSQAVKPGLESKQPGYLILNGEFIPGPYNFGLVDLAFQVNGRQIEAPQTTRSVIAVEPSVAARHEVLQALGDAFQTWTAKDGLEAARRQALQYMQAHPLVERAYFASESDLRVLFQGEQYDESIFLSRSPEQADEPAQTRESLLESQLEAFNRWVAAGALVIINDGVIMVTPPSEGSATLEKLLTVVEETSDVAHRLEAIRAIVPDPDMAGAIASKLERPTAATRESQK